MRAKFEKFFAFFVTALMVFEMVPALAWAEVGDALVDAASGEAASTLATQDQESGDGTSDDAAQIAENDAAGNQFLSDAENDPNSEPDATTQIDTMLYDQMSDGVLTEKNLDLESKDYPHPYSKTGDEYFTWGDYASTDKSPWGPNPLIDVEGEKPGFDTAKLYSFKDNGDGSFTSSNEHVSFSYSAMSYTFVGAGTVSFDYSISTESEDGGLWDGFILVADKKIEFAVGGVVSSSREVAFSGEGEHTICWIYTKDAATDAGDDSLTIRNIKIDAKTDSVELNASINYTGSEGLQQGQNIEVDSAKVDSISLHINKIDGATYRVMDGTTLLSNGNDADDEIVFGLEKNHHQIVVWAMREGELSSVWKGSIKLIGGGTAAEGYEELFTRIPFGVSIDVYNGPYENLDSDYDCNGFVKASFDHDGHAVWSSEGYIGSEGKDSTHSVITIQPSKPCYVVYDYIKSATKGWFEQNVTESIDELRAKSKIYGFSVGEGTNVPDAPDADYQSEDEVIAAEWDTAVLNCSENYQAIILDMLSYGSDNNPLRRGYISNVRVYESIDELPDEYLCTVNVDFPSDLGYAQVYSLSNPNDQREDYILDKQFYYTSPQSVTVPIFSDIYGFYFYPNEEEANINIDGWTLKGPDDDVIFTSVNTSKPNQLTKSRVLTMPGTYTATCQANELSQFPEEINLYVKDNDSGDSWTKREELVQYGNKAFYWETFLYDSNNPTYRIEVIDPEDKNYELTTLNNGSKVEFTQDPTSQNKHYFEVTPKRDDVNIEIKTTTEGVAPTSFYICLLPTMDFCDAFGNDHDDEGYAIIDGLEDNFYDHFNPIDIYTGIHSSETTSWTFEKDSYNQDPEHSKVFVSSNIYEYTETTFTPTKTGVLSFDYKLSGGAPFLFTVKCNGTYVLQLNSKSQGDDSDGSTDWVHYEVPFNYTGENDGIEIKYDNDGNTSNCRISNLQYRFDTKNVRTEMIQVNGGNGKVEINGGDGKTEYVEGTQLQLSAIPDEGNLFLGWYDKSNELLTQSSTYEFTVLDDIVIKAKFIKINPGDIALVGDEVYSDLQTALDAAENGTDHLVRLVSDAKVTTHVVVPAGVTLLIPYGLNDLGYNPREDEYPTPGTADTPNVGNTSEKQLYRTLEVADGGSIEVSGTMIVDAVIGRPKAGWYDQDVSGPYAKITNNGTISVSSGGWLESPGYVEGGNIEVSSGGTVCDLFVVRHWRGGSQAEAMYDENVYPMNEYDCHNITSNITIHSGGTLTGLVRMRPAVGYYETRFPQVDNDNGLIRLAENAKLIKSYDLVDGEGRETYRIEGGASFDTSSLLIVFLELSTGDYLYPWNGIYDFELTNGNYAFTKDFKFMPGATVSAINAHITVEEGKSIVFYDGFDDQPNTGNTQYPSNRPAAKLMLDTDSSLTNNGTFAGTIESETGDITSGANAKWELTTNEANGYYQDRDADGQPKVRSLTFTQTPGISDPSEHQLPITREGYDWHFEGNEIVWTGASEDAINNAISDYETAKSSGEVDGWTQENIDAIEAAIEAAKAALPQPKTEAGEAEIARLASTITDALSEARSNLKKYTVVFDADGGTLAAVLDGDAVEGDTLTRTVIYNDKLGAFPEATKAGWNRTGWMVEGVGTVDENSTVKGDLAKAAVQDEGNNLVITIKAQWSTGAATKITYDLSGGDWKQEDKNKGWPTNYEQHDVTTPTFLIATPVRDGYTFNGWIKNNSGDPQLGMVVEQGEFETLTFKADWKPNTYTLTWETDQGVTFHTENIACDAEISVLSDPSRKGYEFLAWKLVDQSTGKTTEEGCPATMPAHDITVRATWNDCLTLLKNMESKLKDTANLPQDDLDTARKYYGELNESQAQQYDARTLIHAIVCSAIESVNETLEAGYQTDQNIARISVDNDESGEPTIIRVEMTNPDTRAMSMLSVPFLSKLFGAAEVTTLTVGDETLTKNNSTQFNIMLAVAQETIAGKKEGAPKDPEEFRNWLIEREQTLKISILDGSHVAVTLGTQASGGPTYGVYFYNSENATTTNVNVLKTITFDSNGGSAVPDIKKEAGEAVKEPTAPTKPGYTFDGWFTSDEAAEAPTSPQGLMLLDLLDLTEEDEFTFTTMPNESRTILYARWIPNVYTLSYVADGKPWGESAMLKFDEAHVLSSEKPTLVGYEFAGWKAPNGAMYQAGDTVKGLSANAGETVTLAATWKPVQVKVTFAPGGDDVMLSEGDKTKSVTFGSAYGQLPEPRRPGYTFAGWFADDGKTAVTAETAVTNASEHTLTAQWNQNGNVSYDVNVYLEKLDGTYELKKTQSLSAADGSPVTAKREDIEGFDFDATASTTTGTVSSAKKLTLNLYYKRAEYHIKWDFSEGPDPSKTVTKKYRFEEEIVPPEVDTQKDESGIYEFDKWDPAFSTGTKATKDLDNTIYRALFKKTYTAETSDGKTWSSLQDALDNAANTADKLVRLADGISSLEENSNVTIPAGVTLLVPYMKNDPGYVLNYEHQPFSPDNTTKDTQAHATPHSTFTIPASSTLNVEGTLLVNALTGLQATAGSVQDITGGWGKIVLDGSIVVKKGGNFECFGRTTGSGSVTAESGASVGDFFTIQHWRGGSQASAMYSLDVYPYSEYDHHHIEVPITIKAGGTLNGLVKMYALDGFYSTRFPLVDPTNGVIRQTSGEVTKSYENGREIWSITGGANFSRSTLRIVGLNLTTGAFVYPFDGDMDFKLSKGNYTFSEDFKFMPGATVSAQDGAHLTVNSGKTVVFYAPFGDEAFWATGSAAGSGYPSSRGPAMLTLDASSSLQNNGTFAGKISTTAANVQGTDSAKWTSSTLEANGYYSDHVANETRTVTNTLTMSAGSHSWRHSRTGRILWDGEQDTPIQDAIDGSMSGASGGMIGTPDVPYVISATDPKDGKATWTIDISPKALEENASSIGYDIMEEFLAAAHANSSMIASVSTLTGEEPELTYQAKDELQSWPRLFAQKLGLVRATAPEVESMATNPTVEDLVGRHCQLLVTSVKESGMTKPATITYDLIFICSGNADPYRELLPLYRLYNPYDGQHLLTADVNEYDSLKELGWQQEGITSYQKKVNLPAATLAAGVVDGRDDLVYRLYNPSNGDHLYTALVDEVNSLVPLGWNLEGAKFVTEDPENPNAKPVYRLYNPYMTENAGLGSHLYTPDENEYRILDGEGWNQEDIYWYAVALPPKK